MLLLHDMAYHLFYLKSFLINAAKCLNLRYYIKNMNPQQLKIRISILGINPEFPDDRLICSYQDFLKYRAILPYYQFNMKVLDSMVDLACKLWKEEKRINKQSVLGLIATYSAKNKDRLPINETTSRRIFWLFNETVVLDNNNYSEATKDRLNRFANKALKDVILTDEEVMILIKNVHRSKHILNRILRYPVSNRKISSWTETIYFSNLYRKRRAELIGWHLDINPDYVIDKQIIIDDFEFFLREDNNLVSQYKSDCEVYTLMLEENRKQLLRDNPGITDNDEIEMRSMDGLVRPVIKLEQRVYRPNNIIWGYEFPPNLPDLEREREDFYNRIDYFFRITMLWGVAYSHLSSEKKSDLYMKFYTPDHFYSALKIGTRTQNTEFLEWLYKETGVDNPRHKTSKKFLSNENIIH